MLWSVHLYTVATLHDIHHFPHQMCPLCKWNLEHPIKNKTTNAILCDCGISMSRSLFSSDLSTESSTDVCPPPPPMGDGGLLVGWGMAAWWWIGGGLAIDRLWFGGWVLVDWWQIGRGFAVEWQWNGAGLAVAWCRIGDGSVVDWHWIGGSLALDWWWIGKGLVMVWWWLDGGFAVCWCWICGKSAGVLVATQEGCLMLSARPMKCLQIPHGLFPFPLTRDVSARYVQTTRQLGATNAMMACLCGSLLTIWCITQHMEGAHVIPSNLPRAYSPS